jgi:hypothetical protein
MPPKYNKNDYVKVLATAFDNDKRDKAGRNFSEDWVHQGNGIWCYGTISRVYVKRGRQPQKYSIKYDGGQSMPALEGQIEPANEDDEADAVGEENERDGMYESDRDSDNQSTDSYEADNIGWEDRVRETDVTDESCHIRKKEKGSKGNSPRTAWGCACHHGEFFCKNKTWWQEHLKRVRQQESECFPI